MEKKTTIIVISDSHGREDVIHNIPVMHMNADYFFHLGDSELPATELKSYACVKGNNDFDYMYPLELVITIGNHRMFLTHGHAYSCWFSLRDLAAKAKEQKCDVVLFGHTHRYLDMEYEGIRFLNPGSIRMNRDGTPPSYMKITIEEKNMQVDRMNYIF